MPSSSPSEVLGLFFEDFKVGDVYKTPGRTVTEADVMEFAGLSGDYNPLHTDAEFSRTGVFGERVAHGVMTLALLTGLWDRVGMISGTAEAFYGIDNLRFTRPVFFGDTLKATVKVVDKGLRKAKGKITLHNEVTNQRREVVLVCDIHLLMRRRKGKR